MKFVHEDPDFSSLLGITAESRRLNRGIVEKDYWVTHALWALQRTGLNVWFKGGTSLSKGFGLIQRFSEDLDLKIEGSAQVSLPAVDSWKSEGVKAVNSRKAFYAQLVEQIRVPGATVEFDAAQDERRRQLNLQVKYPGVNTADLADVMKPFVLLEIGNARVTPSVQRDLTSFVHEQLEHLGQADAFIDNRPKALQCVHPYVTLLEKLDALQKRAPRENIEPAQFVRHYEDAAQIILGMDRLPAMTDYASIQKLAQDMAQNRQIARVMLPDDVAFQISGGNRARSILEAYEAIGPMFWGPRLKLEEACLIIREWIAKELT